ncbi:hypothetical protein ABZY90_12775 [Streptomyces sp. NPDC006422]|uniref:hypothetical protein n=1 Tax=unclassified Streptomyces TaxID=2593676 RepID=UPI0033B3E84E
MSGEERTRDRHPRRRTAAVVSVAAAVLLAGGGAAYLAANASGGSDEESSARPGGASGGTPPPLALDGWTDGSAASGPSDPAGSAPPGIAPGEPDPNGTRYKAATSLPAGPAKAPVHRAQGEVTAADAARLAEALDVEGKPRPSGDAWKIGPAKDGSGPSLQVNRKAPGTWTYARYAPSTGGKCGGVAKCGNPDGGHAVSEAAAKRAAAPVLKALGQDDAALDAKQLMGATRVVNADPEVGGLPTYGWSTGIQVGADGHVVGGSGRLKAPAKGAEYPTIGAREALERMNGAAAGGRVSVGGCASPVPLGDGKDASCGSAPPPERSTVDVTKATFGLAAHTVAGREALVPSWLFEVRPTGADAAFTVTYPAVEPTYLAAPRSTPTPTPTPSSGSDTRTVRVQGYSDRGKTLTVHFTGGVCATYAASAEESAGRVTVKVTETEKKGTVCVQMAKFYTLPVTLDAPLDGRKVVSADGHTVPHARKNAPGGVEPAPRG